jgi:hypothetical protein
MPLKPPTRKLKGGGLLLPGDLRGRGQGHGGADLRQGLRQGEKMEVAAFKHQIAFNVIPHRRLLDNGYTRKRWK